MIFKFSFSFCSLQQIIYIYTTTCFLFCFLYFFDSVVSPRSRNLSCFPLIAEEPSFRKSNIQRITKVKVREDRDEDHKRDVAVDHKVFASLPIRVSSSSPPVKEEQQDVSPPFVPRIQNTRVLNAVNVTPTVSNSREPEKHDRKVDEKDRSNIRLTSSSSSVLRPRAVLSSPDNDAMIGNKNKIGANRSKVLRNHNFIQNRHVSAQCKVAPSTKSQMHTNLSNEASDKKSDLKGKTSSVMVTPTQRSLRPGKSCFVKT